MLARMLLHARSGDVLISMHQAPDSGRLMVGGRWQEADGRW